MNRDEQLCGKGAAKYAVVKNSSVIEDLGQVTHVFTDKTGTLTKNKLSLLKCYINGRKFEYHRETDTFMNKNVTLTLNKNCTHRKEEVGRSTQLSFS